MNIFLFWIGFTVFFNTLYHVTQKSVAPDAHPITSVIITYIVSLAVAVLVYPLFPYKGGFIESVRSVNWAAPLLGAVIVGIEIGYLMVYRSGWHLSYTSLVANVSVTMLLVPIGILVFHDQFSLIKAVGMVLSIAGLILLNVK